MNAKQRQATYEQIKASGEFIEGRIDYSDCGTIPDVADAAIKLLQDNFDIAIDGSYIKEIIVDACFSAAEKPLEIHSDGEKEYITRF